MQEEVKKLESLIVFTQAQKQKDDSLIDIDCTFDSSSEKFDCFIESLKFARAIRRRLHRIRIKAAQTLAKRELVIILSINIDVIVEEEHSMKTLLNNESQINLISRFLIQRLKLSSEHSESVCVKIVNEDILRTYEVHFLSLKIKNQFDIARYFIEFFLKIDLSSEQLILSLSFFTIVNSNVNYEVREFK